MNPSQAYEKYKHLDSAINDDSLITTFQDSMIRDLWEVVKAEAMKKVSILEVTLNGEVIYSSKEGAK